jgi:hypothetical protein
MKLTLPVIWDFEGVTASGRVDLDDERCKLTSRARTFSFRLQDLAAYAVRRSPPDRLRGLPVLALRLQSGDTLAIASLGGIGSLHDLANAFAADQPVASGS